MIIHLDGMDFACSLGMAGKPNSKREEETMTTKEAFQAIVDHADEPSLNWAVKYAKYGLVCSPEEEKIQALYTVGNITRWRGELAKEVRAALKAAGK
jgi:hypothetical protein